MRELKPLEWRDDKLICLDQTRLPDQEIYLEINSYQQVIDAIKRLAIRGAPAIGIATAYGIVLGSREIRAQNREDFLRQLETVMKSLAASRPTARNLFWAIERMNQVAQSGNDIDHIQHLLLKEAFKIHQEQLDNDLQISKYGATLISDGDIVLTHCNTGVLATAGYGTALGIIKYAFSGGKKIQVI
ncbi:MAG: S-methyl-5-thioribose-1-phosphate isomerase, partial [Dehalococcoidales bacterium]|nr:S-methyl-5-thioribose-1-phosphate isomerase [Dehalococcoidales bacterium]